MAISTYRLVQAAARVGPTITKSMRVARAQGLRTAFLCHSHTDQALAAGLVALCSEAGWDVYIDWQDPGMPPSPTRETAARIKDRIRWADFFLLLATANSLASRWCPWEIGYADGTKPIDTILVIPTSTNGTTHGNEYLSLYRTLDWSTGDQLAVWPPGQTTGGRLLRML